MPTSPVNFSSAGRTASSICILRYLNESASYLELSSASHSYKTDLLGTPLDQWASPFSLTFLFISAAFVLLKSPAGPSSGCPGASGQSLLVKFILNSCLPLLSQHPLFLPRMKSTSFTLIPHYSSSISPSNYLLSLSYTEQAPWLLLCLVFIISFPSNHTLTHANFLSGTDSVHSYPHTVICLLVALYFSLQMQHS